MSGTIELCTIKNSSRRRQTLVPGGCAPCGSFPSSSQTTYRSLPCSSSSHEIFDFAGALLIQRSLLSRRSSRFVSVQTVIRSILVSVCISYHNYAALFPNCKRFPFEFMNQLTFESVFSFISCRCDIPSSTIIHGKHPHGIWKTHQPVP